MAYSSSFAVLLVTVALGGVLIEAAGRANLPFGWRDPMLMNDQADMERITFPSFLGNIVSKMDDVKTAQYVASIQDGTIGERSVDICQDAKLLCDSNIDIVDPTLTISREKLVDGELLEETRKLVAAAGDMRFDEKDIIMKGRTIVLPENFHDSPYPTPSFLPQSLAEKMPFTSEKMPELLDTLKIPHDSNLAVMMSRTVSECELVEKESSKGPAKCVTSLEDMTSFVSTSLPEEKHITALERSSFLNPDKGDRSTDSWKVLEAKLYDKGVVCRNSVFPYAVFECRDISKTKSMRIYSVEMEGKDGAHIKEVAACQQKSMDSGDRESAMMEAEACHWVTDSLVWAPTI